MPPTRVDLPLPCLLHSLVFGQLRGVLPASRSPLTVMFSSQRTLTVQRRESEQRLGKSSVFDAFVGFQKQGSSSPGEVSMGMASLPALCNAFSLYPESGVKSSFSAMCQIPALLHSMCVTIGRLLLLTLSLLLCLFDKMGMTLVILMIK